MNQLTALLTLALAAPAFAGPAAKTQLGSSAALSGGAATGATAESLKAGGALAFGEKAGAPPVSADIRDQYGASQAQASLVNAQATTVRPEGTPPPEPKGGILKKAGDTIKEYTPHMLTAGIGAGAGLVAAKAAGFGLLGGALTGAGIGLASMYLYNKGETGAAIGAASFGLAGLALGGPVGGLVGALVGGLGAWLLGKFLS